MDMHVGMELTWIQFQVSSSATAEKFLDQNMETRNTWGDPGWRAQQARPRHTHWEAGPRSGWKFDAGSCRERCAGSGPPPTTQGMQGVQSGNVSDPDLRTARTNPVIQTAPRQRGTDAAGEKMTDADGLARQISPPNQPPACHRRESASWAGVVRGGLVPLHTVVLRSVPSIVHLQVRKFGACTRGRRGNAGAAGPASRIAAPCLAGPRSRPTHRLLRTLWMNFWLCGLG